MRFIIVGDDVHIGSDIIVDTFSYPTVDSFDRTMCQWINPVKVVR